MGLRRENVWSGQDFNRFDRTFTFDKDIWFKVCPLPKSTVWVKYLIPYHWPYQPNRRDNIWSIQGFYTKVYSHLLNLWPWNLIQDYCTSFSKGTLWVKHKPDWEKEGKNEGVKTNWISLMITSSSTRLLWMADQVLSGKCVSVVALPKSHSLIIPLELTSRFST